MEIFFSFFLEVIATQGFPFFEVRRCVREHAFGVTLALRESGLETLPYP